MKNSQFTYFSLVLNIAILFSALLFTTGCDKNIKHQTINEIVSQAKSKVKVIEAENFKPLIDSAYSYMIIDCRNAEDFIEGHIPGAINIPRGLLEFSNKISDRRSKIFIYGYNDDCSALSAETLLKLKYHEPMMIKDGWEGWSRIYPEIKETGTGEPENESKPPPVKESGGCG